MSPLGSLAQTREEPNNLDIELLNRQIGLIWIECKGERRVGSREKGLQYGVSITPHLTTPQAVRLDGG